MAYRNAPLNGLSVTQMKLIVSARNKPGIHAYYPVGFEASISRFWGELWSSYLKNTCTSTYLFECKIMWGYALQIGDANNNIGLIFNKDKITVGTLHTASKTFSESHGSSVRSTGFHVMELIGKGTTAEIKVDEQKMDFGNLKPQFQYIKYIRLTTYVKDSYFADVFDVWEHHFFERSNRFCDFQNKMLFPSGYARFEPGCQVTFEIKNKTNSEAEISYCKQKIYTVKSSAVQKGVFVYEANGVRVYILQPPSVAILRLNAEYPIAAHWRLSQPIVVYDLSWSAIACDSLFRSCDKSKETTSYQPCDQYPEQCLPAGDLPIKF